MTLSSRQAAPVVVLHGGPSLPADYLYPLEQAVEYRSIVFYDQIGCGRSDEPNDKACYSIDMALDDLEALLKKLGIRRFHLYGQSFGGILAYEYLKRRTQQSQLNAAKDTDPICLSCVLSSTPTSVKRVEETYDQLLDAICSGSNIGGYFTTGTIPHDTSMPNGCITTTSVGRLCSCWNGLAWYRCH
ncbi:alpha/beta hydrolase [Fragilaria crotonensis]|nr:alpha/beta hydrolase [Fragilaria crotonensis]